MFDSHCHLDFFTEEPDRRSVLEAARQAGISGWLLPGFDLRASETRRQVLQLRNVFAAVGIHPYVAGANGNVPSAMQELERLVEEERAVAVGECGLDSRRKGLPFAGQRELFEAQLALARSLDLPVVVHQVGAQRPFQESLERVGLPARGGVVHAFGGDPGWAKFLVKQGFYLGVGPRLLHPRADRLRALVRDLPLERLLVETDAPDQKLPGASRGVPIDLVDVLGELSRARGSESVEVLARKTAENARRLFGLPEDSARPPRPLS